MRSPHVFQCFPGDRGKPRALFNETEQVRSSMATEASSQSEEVVPAPGQHPCCQRGGGLGTRFGLTDFSSSQQHLHLHHHGGLYYNQTQSRLPSMLPSIFPVLKHRLLALTNSDLCDQASSLEMI